MLKLSKGWISAPGASAPKKEKEGVSAKYHPNAQSNTMNECAGGVCIDVFFCLSRIRIYVLHHSCAKTKRSARFRGPPPALAARRERRWFLFLVLEQRRRMHLWKTRYQRPQGLVNNRMAPRLVFVFLILSSLYSCRGRILRVVSFFNRAVACPILKRRFLVFIFVWFLFFFWVNNADRHIQRRANHTDKKFYMLSWYAQRLEPNDRKARRRLC